VELDLLHARNVRRNDTGGKKKFLRRGPFGKQLSELEILGQFGDVISRARLLVFSALLGLAVPRGKAAVTFTKDIAPIFFENCASCHRPGQIAPFALLTYADAKRHAADIAKVTASGYMPPWLPARGFGEFAGERHLSSNEVAAIQSWASSGAVEGNLKDLPEPPKFSEGWELGRPDLVVEMPEPYSLARDGKDLYRNFVIPAPLKETRFVRAFEFHPGNRAVHHVRIKLDPTRQSRLLDQKDAEPGFGGMKTPGKFPTGHMTTWVPGQRPRSVGEGLQWTLEKEADIVLEIHLQRTGKEEKIQPHIGFYFTNTPPTKNSFLVGLTSELIDIPAADTNYYVERTMELPVDVQALTILPHLHYLGKDIEAFAMLPSGKREWLLRIPNWDFNWQGEYHYREPVSLPRGSMLTIRYHYDNSKANARNPNNPVRRVMFGPQSTDEMAELWLQVLVKNTNDLAILQKVQKARNDEETIAYYEWQLRINPNDAAVHTALGKVLGPVGRLEEAVQHFQLALQIDPKLVEAHYYLGLSLLTTREIEGAEREFRAALAYDPAFVKAHDGLGLIALRLNRTAEAEKHFRRALELNPDDPAARSNLQRLRPR
jgi:Flp pilus assembly protein TadD